MTTLASSPDTNAVSTHAAMPLSGPDAHALPSLVSPLPPDEVVSRLSALSKRGKLAGFELAHNDKRGSARHFHVLAFGHPFDRQLHAEVTAEQSGGSCITFRSHLLRKLPAIVILSTIISIWPGVWFTDSMLSTYFSWYPRWSWFTEAWYIPLTLLSIPALWKYFKKSEVKTHAEALETIQKIAGAIEAKS